MCEGFLAPFPLEQVEAVGGGVERAGITNVCVSYFGSQTVVDWICLFLLKTLRVLCLSLLAVFLPWRSVHFTDARQPPTSSQLAFRATCVVSVTSRG